MAGILSLISTVSFVLAGVFLAVAVFFWFYFRIFEVIGDLSGRTARRSIAKMRAQNERTGPRVQMPGESLRRTARMPEAGPPAGAAAGPVSGGPQAGQTTVPLAGGAEETELLGGEDRPGPSAGETVLLNEQGQPGPSVGETVLLNEQGRPGPSMEETALLDRDEAGTVPLAAPRQDPNAFVIIDQAILIHSDELIP